MTTPNTAIAAPQRTCIGCRQTRPQNELVRCVISSTASQQGVVVSRTAAGRGAWLCSLNCFHTAMQRRAFERSWKRSVATESLLTLGDSLRAAFETDLHHKDMKESSVVGNSSDNPTPRKG